MDNTQQLFGKAKAGIVILVAAIVWLYSQSRSINNDWANFAIAMFIAVMLFQTGSSMWKQSMTAKDWLNKGITLNKQGKYDEALQAYDKAIEINSQLADAWYNKGIALDAQGKHEAAIQAYDKAIELNPQYALAWINKGAVLEKLGRDKEADAAFAKAKELGSKATKEDWNSDGMDLFALERYAGAIKAYDMALAADPKYVSAWINKGTALFKLDMDDEAIAAYDEVIKIDPQHADAWNRKGVVLKKIGRTADAADAFAKARELGYKG